MDINELPFFVLLIIYILPITVGIILFARILKLLMRVISKTQEKLKSLTDLGEVLVYMTITVVVVNIVLYLIGKTPSDFSIFEYLIEDMLPITWYVILMYGILIQFAILYSKTRR